MSGNYQELLALFQQKFSHPPLSPLPVLYGGVLLLSNLGCPSLNEGLLPYLEVLVSFLKGITELDKDHGASKLYRALLVRESETF